MIYDKSVTIALPHQYEEGDEVGMFVERVEKKNGIKNKTFNPNDNIVLWNGSKTVWKKENGIWYKDDGNEFVKSDIPKYEFLYNLYEYLPFDNQERIETFELLLTFLNPKGVDFKNAFGLVISNYVNNKHIKIIIHPNGDISLDYLFYVIKKKDILNSKETIIKFYEQ